MTNKSNFNGWSGNTEFTITDLFKANLSGSTRSSSNVSSTINEGPVTITKSSKVSPSRTKSTEPVYKTGDTQTLSVSNLRSINAPLGVDLPFTAGTVDYSFPAGGGQYVDGFNGAIYHIIVDANGKYLLGGSFGNYYYDGGSYYSPYLIRLNSDGTVDDTFNIIYNNDCYGGGFNGTVYTLEIQPDGKILVGGDFTNFDRDGRCDVADRIIRLNSDGSRDLTFNTGDGFDGSVYDIHVQPDGKILLGGDFTVYNGVPAYNLIRLNSNGSVDISFSIGNFDSYVNVIELQSDGKILVGGYFTSYSSITQNYITRLNTDGTLDTTFQIGDGFNDEVYTIALQSDGKIIVGGYFDVFDNNQLFGGHIVRLDSNGTLDTLFGYGIDGPVHSLAIQSDGKILVGGYISDYYPDYYSTIQIGKLVRFNSDCSYDDSYYNSYDVLFNDGVEYITILEDNNILVGGFFNNNGEDPSVYPLNYFGRIHNFISEYPYTYIVRACAQPLYDETITYVVGSLTPLTEDYTYSFQSLQNPSITVCGYLNGRGYPSNIIDYVMVNEYNDCEEAYTSNYKAIIFEECLNYSFELPPFWVVDNKFEIGDIFYNDSVLDGDGRYFLKYAATIVDVIPWSEIPGFYGPVWQYIQPINYVTYSSCDESIEANGLIYGAGSCSEMEGTYPLIHKAIYGPTVLPLPTGNNPVKILYNYYPYGPYEYISGGTPEVYSFVNLGDIYTDNYNDLCELGLTKMSPEGVLNYNFRNTGFNGSLVHTTVEQPDGKILVGGDFNQYLEIDVNNFMRINADGSLDETFNNVYCNSPIWSTETPFSNTTSGSIYFDGTPLCNLSADTNVGVWELGNNNFTFEWFQYFTGDLTHSKSTAFDYQNRLIRVYFEGTSVVLVVDGDEYGYTINPINDVWCHFAITRYYDGDDYIWRIFQDGIELGELLYEISFSQGGPLLLGNTNNPYDNRGFKGYITNFRVNNGNAIYTENFTVPTEPLNPNYTPGNTVLCLSVNNKTDYTLDNCDDEISTSVNSPDYFRGSGFDGGVRAIALQPDGKILIGGNFNYYNSLLSNHIIRLNSDGSIDQGFTYGTEFNGDVNTIALQKDGKIVVGGSFSYYYDFYCPQIIRLNSDGSPDTTFVMGNGFDGDPVYTITIESIRDTPFIWSNNSPITYTENITVGGRFTWYNGTTVRGIVKLSPTGEVLPDFGTGFNIDAGGTPRVNRITQQPDGKLIVVGGSYGYDLLDYNGTWIPKNIVRLVKDFRGIYQIDQTFTTRNWDDSPSGGFGASTSAISVLPNGKIMIGGFFNYYGDNITGHTGISHLVRLNSDGTLDTTFTFQIGQQVSTTLLLSSGRLLVGGRFSTPQDKMLELFIGEEYELRSFETCDGLSSNIFLPTNTQIGTVLDLVPTPQDPDDSNYVVRLPLPFDVNFLGTNYTQVNISTNSYITFGEGGNPDRCCFDIPDQINFVGLPGVFISTNSGDGSSMDDFLINLYSGLTDNGNTMVIRYEGTYLSFVDNNNVPYDNAPPLVYNFKFYKDNSDYFDLIIESNTYFSHNDSTGGTSDGSYSYIGIFDSSSEQSWRINSDGTTLSLDYVPFINSKSIKANVNDRVTVCGLVGDVITTPNLNPNSGVGGSMYFDGNNDTMVQIDNAGGQFGFGGVFDLTIEWFQYWEGGFNSRPFSIGTYGIGAGNAIQVSFEGGGLLWVSGNTYDLGLNLNDLQNKWVHFAITRDYRSTSGMNHFWNVYVNGVRVLFDQIDNTDTSNTEPLIIGNQINNDGKFQGYITNFRVNNQSAIYSGPTMTVPTQPLICDANVILTLDATDEIHLLTDSCDVQGVSSTGVTWSNLTPFFSLYDFSLFTATNFTSYNTCDDCGQLLNTILYVRTGVSEYVTTRTMTKANIDNVLVNGPIFTTGGVEAYEIINYYY